MLFSPGGLPLRRAPSRHVRSESPRGDHPSGLAGCRADPARGYIQCWLRNRFKNSSAERLPDGFTLTKTNGDPSHYAVCEVWTHLAGCSTRRSPRGRAGARRDWYNHVIEALTSDRADEALDVGVLPRRFAKLTEAQRAAKRRQTHESRLSMPAQLQATHRLRRFR